MSEVLENLRGGSRRDGVVLRTQDDVGRKEVRRSELCARVERLTRAIASYSNPVIGIHMDNGVRWVIGDLAVAAAGRVCIPLPTFFTPAQIGFVAQVAGISAWILDSNRPPTPRLPKDWITEEVEPGLWLGVDVGAENSGLPIPSGTAKITFTSGTTGMPKGVCLSQKALESVAGSLSQLSSELELRAHLCALPLPLLLENVVGVYAALMADIPTTVLSLDRLGWSGSSSLDMKRFVDSLIAWEPHSLILVPELLQGLVSAVEAGDPAPTSLRFIAVGGGRVSTGLLERAERIGLPVFEGYGLSESASVVALNRPGAVRVGSVGRVLPHASVRIEPDGEIVVSGAAMQGYLGQPPLDEAGCGEVHTGDIGSLDSDGFLRIDGRKRNVFITSLGRNVSPEWVESELAQMPDVGRAVVFGEARPFNVAILVPRSAEVTDSDLDRAVEAANARLPDYAHIRHWIRAREAFTADNGLLTATGKVRREGVELAYRDLVQSLYEGASDDSGGVDVIL